MIPDALADRVRVIGKRSDGRVLLAVPPLDVADTVDALTAWAAS